MAVTPPTLADRIRAAREKAMLSQPELGQLLGVPRRTIQNWETGAWPKKWRDRRTLETWLQKMEAAE